MSCDGRYYTGSHSVHGRFLPGFDFFIILIPDDGVSHHQPFDCLLNGLFRRWSKKTSKLRVTGPCEGNSPVTGEFPAQRASNAENVSIWRRHSAYIKWIPIFERDTIYCGGERYSFKIYESVRCLYQRYAVKMGCFIKGWVNVLLICDRLLWVYVEYLVQNCIYM